VKVIEVLLAVSGCIAGLVSAWYWLKASSVPIEPIWSKYKGVEPGVHSLSQDGWIGGVLEATLESGRLNKIAARWTAATVALTVIGTLASALSG
jgi:hypothetical protein